jgi:diketogulonate reductase-like aldo/keto reductase
VTPTFIYGTAWSQTATAELVKTAVRAGFRAIDTANQPKHYSEALVGEALEAIYRDGCSRDALWIQTKFTPLNGHDERVPYDAQADLTTQVKQSFESSLQHLKTDRVDSYLLHGPYSSSDLIEDDWEVWRAMEDIYRSGGAGSIGISNVTPRQLAALVEGAQIKPTMVQNRCYASRGWDCQVRAICREQEITYQGFSLLTANVPVLRDPALLSIARRLGVDTRQIVFRFAMQVGIVPLTGTTDEKHMKDDLDVARLELTTEEVSLIESVATRGPNKQPAGQQE